MPNWFRRLDRWLDSHLIVLGLLLSMSLLRLPNFFEPYWYGDEGIYLVIGTALRMGKTLYLQIIDHKTPLIYYFAMVPSQLWFRVLNYVVAFCMVILFYRLSKRLFHHGAAIIAAGVVFVALTTLPALEGNIPNGELFVMFFVLCGIDALSHSKRFAMVYTQKENETLAPQTSRSFLQDLPWLLFAGTCFGLGILTKVPAIFDLFAAASVLWWAWSESVWQSIIGPHRPSVKLLWQPLLQGAVLLLGVILPIAVSVAYFLSLHAGQAYLDYGLLYNFRYSTEWQLNLGIPALNSLFSLPGKAGVLALIMGILTILPGSIMPRKGKAISAWLALTLFAALLSNRPYPHYFLQVVPSAALWIGLVVESFRNHHWHRTQRVAITAVSGGFTALIIGVFILLNVHMYPTFEYYTRFASFASGQISWTTYAEAFDGIVKDNYQTAKYFERQQLPFGAPLLIWGTNPTLYALSHTIPVGRFTVLFHIRDFHAEAETVADFMRVAPRFVVIMKNEEAPTQLELILHRDYAPTLFLDHFTVWQRRDVEVPSVAITK